MPILAAAEQQLASASDSIATARKERRDIEETASTLDEITSAVSTTPIVH
jgi:hypothetical protein